MPNTLATPLWVTKKTAQGYLNKLVALNHVNRTYDDQYVQTGAKVGNTVLARLPQRFTVTDGQALQIQAIYDQTVPITLTNQKNVAFGYSSAQKTTELDMIEERYVQPGAEALASASELLFFLNTYRDIYSSVGTPGVTPSSVLTYLQAQTKLTDLSTPLSERCAVLDPLAMQTIANTSSTLFNPSGFVSQATREGMWAGNLLGADWYQDPVVPTHTTGTFTSCTPTVNSANQTGSTLNTQSWASGATTLKRGDTFTAAGCNSVNPLSYQDNGRLQQFVITADSSDTTGNITALPISPSIITAGQLQTVAASPSNGGAITVTGATSATSGTLTTTTSRQSFVWHPDAFAFVMADMFKPEAGANSEVVRSKSLGFSIRMVEQYQIGTDQNPSRLDILIGAATLQPRLACRVWG